MNVPLVDRLREFGAVDASSAVTAAQLVGGSYPSAGSVAGGLRHLHAAGLVGVKRVGRLTYWWAVA